LITQHGPEQSLLKRLQQYDPLAPGDHDAGQSRLALFPHCVPDNREGFLGDLVLRGDVVRRFEIALIYLVSINEALDIDRVGAFDADLVEVLFLDDEEVVLPDSIPFDLILGADPKI
jgi:hypothetical protein